MSEIFSHAKSQAAEIDRLRRMTLGQFRFENTWLKVESELLPSLEYGEIYIASSEDVEREIKVNNPRVVVYGPGELKRIMSLDPSPETMLAIHQAKAILGGRVVETKPREDMV